MHNFVAIKKTLLVSNFGHLEGLHLAKYVLLTLVEPPQDPWKVQHTPNPLAQLPGTGKFSARKLWSALFFSFMRMKNLEAQFMQKIFI